MTPYEQGKKAYLEGRWIHENPYLMHLENHNDWAKGFTDAWIKDSGKHGSWRG